MITRVEVWENEKAVKTQAEGKCFHCSFEFPSQVSVSVAAKVTNDLEASLLQL